MINTTVDLVTIQAVDPPGPTVVCRHGDGISQPSSAAGWQLTQRPKRVSMTEYMGPDPYTLVVPLIFGGNATDHTNNVDPVIETLRGIMRNPVGPRNEPAVVQIRAALVPMTWLRWVIQDMTTKAEMRNDDGVRFWAQIDVTFYQWEPTDLTIAAGSGGQSPAQQVAAQATQQSSGSVAAPANPLAGVPSSLGWLTSHWTYTAKAGDTLTSIAAKMLGNASLWSLIGALNSIRDPSSIVPGQVLRMPGEEVPIGPGSAEGNGLSATTLRNT